MTTNSSNNPISEKIEEHQTESGWKSIGSHTKNEVVYIKDADDRHLATVHGLNDGKDNPARLLESEANTKIFTQAKNNFLLLKQLESLYVNKKERASLTIFEDGIFLDIQKAIKKTT